MSDELSFAELIEALLMGDPQAVAELERLYGDHLRRVARRKLRQLGAQNWADSVEICQSVWLDLLRKPLAAVLGTPDQLLAYLYAMVENKARAFHRTESTLGRDRSRQDPSPIENHGVLDEEPQPVVRIMDRELAAEIREKMGDVISQVHDLHCGGLEWTQIGEQLRIAPDALRK